VGLCMPVQGHACPCRVVHACAGLCMPMQGCACPCRVMHAFTGLHMVTPGLSRSFLVSPGHSWYLQVISCLSVLGQSLQDMPITLGHVHGHACLHRSCHAKSCLILLLSLNQLSLLAHSVHGHLVWPVLYVDGKVVI